MNAAARVLINMIDAKGGAAGYLIERNQTKKRPDETCPVINREKSEQAKFQAAARAQRQRLAAQQAAAEKQAKREAMAAERQLAIQQQRQERDSQRKNCMSKHQRAVYLHVQQNPQQSALQIAENIGLDEPSVQKIVRVLTQRGFIQHKTTSIQRQIIVTRSLQVKVYKVKKVIQP